MGYFDELAKQARTLRIGDKDVTFRLPPRGAGDDIRRAVEELSQIPRSQISSTDYEIRMRAIAGDCLNLVVPVDEVKENGEAWDDVVRAAQSGNEDLNLLCYEAVKATGNEILAKLIFKADSQEVKTMIEAHQMIQAEMEDEETDSRVRDHVKEAADRAGKSPS